MTEIGKVDGSGSCCPVVVIESACEKLGTLARSVFYKQMPTGTD